MHREELGTIDRPDAFLIDATIERLSSGYEDPWACIERVSVRVRIVPHLPIDAAAACHLVKQANHRIKIYVCRHIDCVNTDIGDVTSFYLAPHISKCGYGSLQSLKPLLPPGAYDTHRRMSRTPLEALKYKLLVLFDRAHQIKSAHTNYKKRDVLKRVCVASHGYRPQRFSGMSVPTILFQRESYFYLGLSREQHWLIP
ncbi:hypothetical protein ASD14_08500 [Lysobacter sp. Root494]|nr:hypothetical protein ASD14_08500 [Lysobacter sp. Root494]